MAVALSRYELLDRIAVGGMAEVFRAKAFGSHGFEKTLAIKKILPELAKDPEFEERFIAEAKLAVQLSHANVVQVLDFGRFAGTLFIAMELVKGLDLAALLKFYTDKGERVPIPAAFQIAIELVRGLSFAHQHGVVHRDVSPSNILLSKAGEVKIADFGIAMAMREELSVDEGRIMGKWRYMSPEQTRGTKLDKSSDLFSAAVVIYEVFAGAKLFPGAESKEIIENIHCMPIPRLSELRPGVPEAVDDVLAAALERNADVRTDSGADMLRALTEASYKSSIVATSIDVADAVEAAETAGVIGASAKPGQGMDALIREQLRQGNSDQPRPTERRTKVQEEGAEQVEALANTEVQPVSANDAGDGGTMVRSGVDARGVTMWKLDRETVAAIPSAKRIGDTAAALAALDSGNERYEQDPGGHVGLRRGVIISAVVFLGLMVVLIGFALVGGPSKTRRQAVIASHDAAVLRVVEPVTSELLLIDSEPGGATVYIGEKKLENVTPTEVKVPIDTEVRVRLVLDGYEEYRSTKTLKPGRALDFRPTLVPYKSTLIVTTKPPGARVVLDGQDLGTTPLTNSALRPGKERALSIVLKDYQPVELTVNLVRDTPTSVSKTLKSTVVYGTINIGLGKHWFEVREGSVYLGDTPGTFRLPVGTHRLRLTNPPTGRSMKATVQVLEKKVKTYRFDF